MAPSAASRDRAVLEVRDVRKAFDGFQAVGGVSLEVPRGQIAAIIGPNGAGKTTLFNLITGHLRPDAGAVALDGRDITGLAPHDVCRLGMGRSFQRTNIFPKLTVFQNVQAAFISHRGRGLDLFSRVDRLYRDETDALLASLGLLDRAGEMSGFLSHGAQKQLELGIALASEPRLLLLDEPTAGMSAAETRETIQLISRIASERGLTLLFTEHDMEVVFSIAQRITVLHQGRVIAEGRPADVRNDPEVRRVYLGERR
jgi:branched-chain amino acid transport system ATP-binding protein